MQTFTMLVGLPGSGKSSLAMELVLNSERKTIIVCPDRIRGELWGDESDQRNPEMVFDIAHRLIRKYLEEGYDVIFDATNLSSKRRKGLLNLINTWHIKVERICIVVGARVETCIARQVLRTRKVPTEVIWRMAKSFQVPIKSEGWDKILVYCTGEKYNLIDIYDGCQTIAHDNKHHKFTIGAHMAAAEKHSYLFNKNDVLTEAARFHDIGKFYTKDFHDANGNPTEDAHFYGHQNVGAYMYLCGDSPCTLTSAERLIVATLIQYHMEHYMRNEKGMENLERKLGKKVFKMLEQLHLCDKAAH